jgi:hypothetical protein
MTAPITKRADQLVVGDRILPESLPTSYFKEIGEVVFVKVHDYHAGRYVFVAYMQDNGFYDSTSYEPDSPVMVYPADAGLGYSRADDGETTQPIAGRVPPHFGAVVDEGGNAAVEVAGGLIEIDPPEGYFIVPHGPAKPPYGTPEREAYDRSEADEPDIDCHCGHPDCGAC